MDPITITKTRPHVTALGLAAALTMLPLSAMAQPAAPPSYAQPGSPAVTGTIAGIEGKYRLRVRDQHGYIDDVTLHQGTIINPTGLPLEPGDRVTIYGQPAGTTFLANEIDVPYVAALPYADGYGPGYPGWGYGGFGFGFGFRHFGYRGW